MKVLLQWGKSFLNILLIKQSMGSRCLWKQDSLASVVNVEPKLLVSALANFVNPRYYLRISPIIIVPWVSCLSDICDAQVVEMLTNQDGLLKNFRNVIKTGLVISAHSDNPPNDLCGSEIFRLGGIPLNHIKY